MDNQRRPDRLVHDHLAKVARLYPARDGMRWLSAESLVFELGRPYRPAPLPPGVERGPMMFCYRNARQAAIEHGWMYVEGFTAVHGIVIQHAWCAPPGSDEALEVTWPDQADGVGYYGVAFSLDWLAEEKIGGSEGTYSEPVLDLGSIRRNLRYELPEAALDARLPI